MESRRRSGTTGRVDSETTSVFQLLTMLTKFSSHDDYFFAFCERKKQASAPRQPMKTSSFSSASAAFCTGSADKKIQSAAPARFAMRSAKTIAMSIFECNFSRLLCAPFFRNPSERITPKNGNQGPIHLDISGGQAILSIRFFM